MLSIENYPFELDDSVSSLGSIGLVTPANNTVLEGEFTKMCDIPGVLTHTNRIHLDTKGEVNILNLGGDASRSCWEGVF